MIRSATFVLLWFACMFSSLLVERLDFGHAVCGNWGCGPPTSALLGMNLFWLTVILPPILLLSTRLALPWKTIGTVVAAASIAGLVAFGVYDYFGDNRGYYDAGYVWQRYLLSLATFGVDVPIVQVFATSLTVIVLGQQCQCCAKANEPRKAEAPSKVSASGD